MKIVSFTTLTNSTETSGYRSHDSFQEEQTMPSRTIGTLPCVVISASMANVASIARIVEALAYVSTGDNAIHARTAEALAYVTQTQIHRTLLPMTQL